MKSKRKYFQSTNSQFVFISSGSDGSLRVSNIATNYISRLIRKAKLPSNQNCPMLRPRVQSYESLFFGLSGVSWEAKDAVRLGGVGVEIVHCGVSTWTVANTGPVRWAEFQVIHQTELILTPPASPLTTSEIHIRAGSNKCILMWAMSVSPL